MELLEIKQNDFRKDINLLTMVIKRGGVIVCPTDTIYGLIADATNKKAVNKLFKLKKRSFKKPVSLFIKKVKIVKELAEVNKTRKLFKISLAG